MSGPQPQSLTLVESVPASLYDLLRRELAFKHTRSLLVKSLEEAQRNVQVLKATRPPFLLLKPSDVKRELNQALASAEEAVTLLEKGLAKLDRQEPQLHGFVAYRLETHLRKSSPAYIRSLVEKHHAGDWQCIQRQFEHYMTAFNGSLALLEASVAGLPPWQSIGGDPSCKVLLAQAIANARAFEAEIAFLNKVSDAQSRQTGPDRFTLHRQLELDWIKALEELASEDSKSGAPALRQLIRQLAEISQNAHRAIQDECPTAIDAQEPADSRGFHAIQWSILRDVVRLRTHPGEFEAIARETELLLENGRIAELAHSQEAPAVPADHRAASTQPAASQPAQIAAPPPKRRKETEPALILRRTTGSTPPIPLPADTPPAAAASLAPAAALHTQKHSLEKEIEELRNEQQELIARAKFIEDSENKLLDRTQEQQEREIMLEQRAEDLLSLEKRLRETYPQALLPAAPAHPFDEFNE